MDDHSVNRKVSQLDDGMAAQMVGDSAESMAGLWVVEKVVLMALIKVVVKDGY